MDIDDVAGLDERIAEALTGPLPIGGQQDHFSIADAGMNLERQSAGDDRVHIVTGTAGEGPVGMPVLFNVYAAGEDVFKLAFPAMAAFVDCETVGDCAVRRLLQSEIESGLDAEPVFVDFVRAESLLKFAAHFFLEPRGDGGVGLRDVQAQRRLAGFLRLLVRNVAVGLHFAEHKIASAQSFVRVEQRRVGDGALGQTGQKSCLGEFQVFGVF